MRGNWAYWGLIAVNGFVALTAVGGGIALVTGLERDRFPLETLAGTPFDSYLIPGLLLTTVVGGSAAVATVVLLRHPQQGAVAALLAGLVMLGWIAGEMLLLDQPVEPTGTELVYLGLGAAMVGLGWRIARIYRTESSKAS